MKDIRYGDKWFCGCRSKDKTRHESLLEWEKRRVREKQSYCPNCRNEEQTKNGKWKNKDIYFIKRKKKHKKIRKKFLKRIRKNNKIKIIVLNLQ